MAFKRNQLLYFITVADEGQITLAAAKLHIAQPALSHAITALESELGLELFERHARGVTLTPAGRTFLEKARMALGGRSRRRADRGITAAGGLGQHHDRIPRSTSRADKPRPRRGLQGSASRSGDHPARAPLPVEPDSSMARQGRCRDRLPTCRRSRRLDVAVATGEARSAGPLQPPPRRRGTSSV